MTTLVKDLLTDTDGTALTAHTPDISGAHWLVVEQGAGCAAPSIKSNALKLDGGAGVYNETSVALPASGGYGTADYLVTGTVNYATNDASEQFLTARVDTAVGGFAKYSFGWYRAGTTAWQLRKYTGLNGTYTVLASAPASFPTGDQTLVMRVVTVAGHAAIQCKANGVVVLTTYTDAASPYTTGIAGVVGFDQSMDYPPLGIFVKDFQVDTIPTGAQDVLLSVAPAGAIPATPFGTQPSGTIADAYGVAVTGQADTITVSKVSGPGTLSGTLTASVNTATGGWAFTNVQADTAGTYTVQFASANGYAPATATFTVYAQTALFAPSVIGTAITDAGLGALLDGGCTIELRDGTVPTSVAASATGTVLATATGGQYGTIQFPPSDQFSQGGVASLVPPAMVTASASGTPTFLRVLTSGGTPVMVVTCGPTGRVVTNASTIAAGQRLQLETLWWNDPGQTLSIATQVGGVASIGGTMDGPAELPRVYIDSSYPDMTGATIYRVGAGQTYSSIAAAWAAAVRPARIIVSNGTDLTPAGGLGLNFGAKAGTGWVTIEAATMPTAAGVRVSPAAMSAVSAPKIRLDNATAAVFFGSNCHHVRFMGFEVLPAAAGAPAQSQWLVTIMPDNSPASNFGNGASYAELPHDIVIDRCYLHGSASTDILRGCPLNGNTLAVVESYLSEIHCNAFDADGFAGWLGQGPLKIVNNYCEATAENILIGGAESPWGVVPSDIEVRYNTFQKPASWQGVYTTLKTLVEFKAGVRVLIEGNDLLNNWEGGAGWWASSITLKTVNQGGEADPWWRLSDVTVRHNRVQYSGALVNIHPMPEAKKPATGAARFSVRNNLAAHMGDPPSTGGSAGLIRAWAFTFDGLPRMGLTDCLYAHNTYVAPNGAALGATAINDGSTGTLPAVRLVCRDSLFATRATALTGQAVADVDGNLSTWWGASSDLTHNTFSTGSTGSRVSARAVQNDWLPNTTDATYPELGFAKTAGEDYSLVPGSTYSATGSKPATDGTARGVDMVALLAALAGSGGGSGGGGGTTTGPAWLLARFNRAQRY